MRIPGFIRRDFALKFVSLVLAVCIYVGVSGYLKEESSLELPVDIQLTQDVMMTVPQQFKVDINIRGNKRDIGRSNEIKCQVKVGLKDRQRDGSFRIKLKGSDFHIPRGITVTKIVNPELTLQLQPRISRELPVSLVFSGEPPSGYRVSRQACDPRTVLVSGPENELGDLSEVSTDPVPLEDCRSSFDYEVKLRKPAHLELSPARVTAKISIDRNFATRSFAKVPVGIFYDAKSGIAARFNSAAPSFAMVTVNGIESEINRFRSNEMRLYVDVSDISTAGEYTLPVICQIRREGIRIKQVAPSEFKVIVSKSPIKK